MAYVDLNPIRAKLAKTSEKSAYTSIKQRVQKLSQPAGKKQPKYLKPLQAQSQSPQQAVPYTLNCYLQLVNWTGRVIQKDKRGSISTDTPLILE